MIVTAGAGAEGFSSREFGVRAGLALRGRVFGYFPVRVILEVVVIIRKGNGNEGKLESLGEPTRGSRDSSKDFIVVGRSETEISFHVMSSTGGDHAATFFCLDRVIVASGG